MIFLKVTSGLTVKVDEDSTTLLNQPVDVEISDEPLFGDGGVRFSNFNKKKLAFSVIKQL